MRYGQTTSTYKQLVDSVSGFHFNFLCNLIYADCGRTQTYGYYQNVEHDTASHGGGCCGIPCLLEIQWGTTNYSHTKSSLAVSMERLNRTMNEFNAVYAGATLGVQQAQPYKLHLVSETADEAAVAAHPGADKLKLESSVDRAGILCCLGYRSVRERFGLFATSKGTAGLQLPAEKSHEPVEPPVVTATMQ